ncbi:STT3 domain-containing protein [Thermovibrio sp.]
MSVKKISLLLILILIPLTVGLNIRLDDLKVWERYKPFFFYEGRALFTSYDAFYFAKLGKDYLEGVYKGGEKDPLRFVPDNATYPEIIPMESWLGAKIAKAQGTYIENISVWLTPLLAVLVVIPLILYFYELKLPLTGFGASLLTVVSLLYLIRTSIARFDTDSLNLFFPFTIALFLLHYFKAEGKERIVSLFLAGVASQLYYWWYQHPGINLAIFLLFIVALFLTKELKVKELALSMLFFNPVIIGKGILNVVGLTKTYVINYFKPEVQGFPNVLMSISEAKHIGLPQIGKLTCGNELLLLIGLIGLGALFIRRFYELLLLAPILFIGLMVFFGGNRFAMYLAPFVGAGLGYLLEFVINKVRKEKLKLGSYLIGFILLTGLIIGFNLPSFKVIAKPKITPQLEGDFLKLQKLTPKGSWVWSWWDYGTAIEYLSRRATYHDGQSQGSPKTYFVATSYSTSQPQVAYNVILGISNLGAEGIKELLKKGKSPEEIRDEVFSGKYSKKVNSPVYWAFTGDEIGKFFWINYFGTWDFKFKKGERNGIIELRFCKENERELRCQNTLFDKVSGKVLLNGKGLPVKRYIIKEKKAKEIDYGNSFGITVEKVITQRGALYFLMAEQPFRSMFNQMYILRNYDRKLFKLVYDDFPTMVLYRVKGTGEGVEDNL